MILTKNNMKTIKIVFLVFVSILMSQQALNIEQISPFKDEAWADFKKRVNEYVLNRSIDRSEAEYLFSGFRVNYGISDFRQQKHDKVMQEHFFKYGEVGDDLSIHELERVLISESEQWPLM